MGTILILPETTRNPIQLMGQRAGVCWGADTTNPEKNYKRGMDCISSGHGRVMEYVNVEMVLEGYSARVIREWYTHLGGSPTRLQASTRYIDYEHGFEYIVPESIRDDEKRYGIYLEAIHQISKALVELEGLGAPREDTALLLPLGMTTKIVDKRNLRNLVDMSRQRMCTRAYHEYRQLFEDIRKELYKVSNEWKWIVDNLFYPKCEEFGYCPEKKSCGKMHKWGE